MELGNAPAVPNLQLVKGYDSCHDGRSTGVGFQANLNGQDHLFALLRVYLVIVKMPISRRQLNTNKHLDWLLCLSRALVLSLVFVSGLILTVVVAAFFVQFLWSHDRFYCG